MSWNSEIIKAVDDEITNREIAIEHVHRGKMPCPTCGNVADAVAIARAYGKQGHKQLMNVLAHNPVGVERAALRAAFKRLYVVCLSQTEAEAERLIEHRMGTET